LSNVKLKLTSLIKNLKTDNFSKDGIFILSPQIAHQVLSPEWTGNLYANIQKNVNKMMSLLREFVTLSLAKKSENKVQGLFCATNVIYIEVRLKTFFFGMNLLQFSNGQTGKSLLKYFT